MQVERFKHFKHSLQVAGVAVLLNLACAGSPTICRANSTCTTPTDGNSAASVANVTRVTKRRVNHPHPSLAPHTPSTLLNTPLPHPQYANSTPARRQPCRQTHQDASRKYHGPCDLWSRINSSVCIMKTICRHEPCPQLLRCCTTRGNTPHKTHIIIMHINGQPSM